VRDLGELLARRVTDALRGRVGRAQVRVLRLELHQLLKETIVFGVRNLGRVFLVVEAVVALDRAPQLLGARGRLARRGHAS
jgi:hypothetical protein